MRGDGSGSHLAGVGEPAALCLTLLPVDEAIRWTLAAEGGPFILSPLDQGRGGDVSGQTVGGR